MRISEPSAGYPRSSGSFVFLLSMRRTTAVRSVARSQSQGRKERAERLEGQGRRSWSCPQALRCRSRSAARLTGHSRPPTHGPTGAGRGPHPCRWDQSSGPVATPLDGVRPAQPEPDLPRSRSGARDHARHDSELAGRGPRPGMSGDLAVAAVRNIANFLRHRSASRKLAKKLRKQATRLVRHGVCGGHASTSGCSGIQPTLAGFGISPKGSSPRVGPPGRAALASTGSR